MVIKPKRTKVVKEGFKCLRCGHVTVTRDGEAPGRCGGCKSPNWDRPWRGHVTCIHCGKRVARAEAVVEGGKYICHLCIKS